MLRFGGHLRIYEKLHTVRYNQDKTFLTKKHVIVLCDVRISYC